jgi:hypothetical protein
VEPGRDENGDAGDGELGYVVSLHARI